MKGYRWRIPKKSKIGLKRRDFGSFLTAKRPNSCDIEALKQFASSILSSGRVLCGYIMFYVQFLFLALSNPYIYVPILITPISGGSQPIRSFGYSRQCLGVGGRLVWRRLLWGSSGRKPIWAGGGDVAGHSRWSLEYGRSGHSGRQPLLGDTLSQ
jgi:hypothetical protein